MSTPAPGQAYWANENGQLPNASKLTVFFTTLPVRHNKKSEEAGFDPDDPDMSKGIFEDRVHIVKLPADATLRICRIPTKEDIREYKAQYEEYMRTKETKVPGIPIDQWPQISESMKLTFKAMGILTVDQLANAGDGFGQHIMDFQNLRNKARAYVNIGKDNDLIAQIKAEASAEVSAMKKQMAEMQAMLEQLTKPKDAA